MLSLKALEHPWKVKSMDMLWHNNELVTRFGNDIKQWLFELDLLARNDFNEELDLSWGKKSEGSMYISFFIVNVMDDFLEQYDEQTKQFAKKLEKYLGKMTTWASEGGHGTPRKSHAMYELGLVQFEAVGEKNFGAIINQYHQGN